MVKVKLTNLDYCLFLKIYSGWDITPCKLLSSYQISNCYMQFYINLFITKGY